MIWNSTALMTIIDLAVIVGGVYVAVTIYRYRRIFRSSKNATPLLLIAAGASVISAFYLADLFIMWGLPHLTGKEEAMALMAALHLNVSWIAITVGFGAITGGLILMVRSFARLVHELESKEHELVGKIEEAETATRAAEIANDSKSQFLANMSHELRTPLNAIIGFSETMHQQTFGPVGSPKYIEYADNIGQAGRHLLTIINDVLDLSKIEAGRLNLFRRHIDVNDVINDSIALLQEGARSRGIDLSVVDPVATVPLFADQRILKQILINLLSNGIKFTPKGGRVTVSTAPLPDGGCILRVSDTGIGIPADEIAVALMPFEQVGSALTQHTRGTGLGLPLCKSLTERHGGTFELESAEGGGTTVTLRFAGRENSRPKVA
tara:strand:- start:14577 stop:15716 length:1140 start_codon:yes stop_codon:yes gene_type:complete